MRDLAILFSHLVVTITRLIGPGGARSVVLKPSTLLAFHAALVKRKYRQLFSPKRRGKPGPKGPLPKIIAAIVETKRLNPSWGCCRIAQQLCEECLCEFCVNELCTALHGDAIWATDAPATD